MSRIRSVHPGLFTDPEFLQVGMTARMLLIGLWTEADDRGVFEWKPLALKIKLFPVDSVDVEALLSELIAAERVKRVEYQGKAYGICRKFCKYQRPKNPSEGLVFILEWASFVHLLPQDPRYKALGFPPEGASPPPSLPQEGVKPSADGEERRVVGEERKKEPPASSTLAFAQDFEAWWKVYPRKDDKGHALKAYRKARKRGVLAETLLAGAVRYRDDPKRDKDFTKAPGTWLNGECWGDEGTVAPPAPKVRTPEEREMEQLRDYARIIVEQKRSPGVNFSNVHKQRLLGLGWVTPEQFNEAGCAA